MIATNEAADVLRHGWQDAASTLAADIPEVAELLQARLEMAIASQRLDERHLLDTIEEVESVSSRAGSPASQALARRLRRTVYEYLLALDAARPMEVAAPDMESPAPFAGPMVGAEEVAAMGHALLSRGHEETEEVADAPVETTDTAVLEDLVAAAPALPDPEPTTVEATEPESATVDEALSEPELTTDEAISEPELTTVAVSAAETTSRRRFALRLRRRHGAEPSLRSLDALLADDDALPLDESAEEPGWRFTPPDQSDGAVDEAEPGAEPSAEAEPEPLAEAEAEAEPEVAAVEAQAEPVAEAEAEPDPEPEAVAEAEPELEPEAAAVEPEPEAVAEAEPEPEAEARARARGRSRA